MALCLPDGFEKLVDGVRVRDLYGANEYIGNSGVFCMLHGRLTWLRQRTARGTVALERRLTPVQLNLKATCIYGSGTANDHKSIDDEYTGSIDTRHDNSSDRWRRGRNTLISS